MRFWLVAGWAVVSWHSAGLAADDARWRAEGRNVLVVYAADDADSTGAGKGDSRQAAEYYARRRGVPAENLLGLKVKDQGPRRTWTYADFYRRLLVPVWDKLHPAAPEASDLSRRVCYILLCPGLPIEMNTHYAPSGEKSHFRSTRLRSVDGYLVSLAANFRAGLEVETATRPASQPAAGRDGPLGASVAELVLPIFGAYNDPTGARHFRQLRDQQPGTFDFHLVSRLGVDLTTARNMLDGALYAERYLRLPAADDRTSLRRSIWLDQKYGFAGDHVASMTRAVAIVRGVVPGSPFALGEGLRRAWPLVVDNRPEEIGLVTGGVQHKPTVQAKIVADGVDPDGLTLEPPARATYAADVPVALYFPPGCKVTCVKAAPASAPMTQTRGAGGRASSTSAAAPASGIAPVTATVLGADIHKNRLLLDSTAGFAPGDTVRYVWPGTFPADDCFIFYGFYGLLQFEDVFKFPPGSIGVHVDSCCMVWARGAMSRGIAATYGVTTEPLSSGIPYGHQMLLALSAGYDWAEAVYGAVRLSQRWAGVTFGDPLYAPFRSRQLADKTPPAFKYVRAAPAGPGAVITAELADADEDQAADVALFKLEYGPTDRYGQVVDFFDWPQPEKSKDVRSRRFAYSRHFRHVLAGLEKGKTYHYRLTARDPAGLETAAPDATFVP